MKLLKKKYFHYELEYYLQPGKWMNDSELLVLEHLLDHVNALSGRNFDYGVLDRTSSPEEQRKIFETANLCVIKDHGEPIGFFYNMILREKPIPVIHAGLVMVAKNQGHDLIGYPYSYMTYLQFKQF